MNTYIQNMYVFEWLHYMIEFGMESVINWQFIQKSIIVNNNLIIDNEK